MVTMVTQLVGLVLLIAGLTWLLGPWALVVAGVALLVVPELLEARRGGAGEVETAARAAERGEGVRR